MKIILSPKNEFLAAKKVGTHAEHCVAEKLQLAFPDSRVIVKGGRNEPDLIMVNDEDYGEVEVKSHPAWVDTGRLAIEFEDRRGRLIGPMKYLLCPDLRLFANYIPELDLVILAHPLDLVIVLQVLEKADRVETFSTKNGSKMWLVDCQLLIKRLHDFKSFYMLQGMSPIKLYKWSSCKIRIRSQR